MADTIAEPETATCRGCGRRLEGKPYSQGGRAYIPGPKREQAPANFYGGFVCSPRCDFRASLELEQTMPGHGYDQKGLGCFAQASFERNWPNR